MYGQDLVGVDDIIGGRPFVEYLGVLTAVAGRAQKHLCLSAILQRRHPHLQLANLLTTFSPIQDFLTALTRHLDGETLHVQQLMRHLTLSPDNKEHHLSSAETAWAPLIQASRDSLILPVYGLDINPFLFLLNDLRHRYPAEWFEAANRREKRWIDELQQLFPAPRWKTGRNVKLRTSGRVVTDLDFWALDTLDNSVALIQLKWQQPVGMDNRARRSAGRNLLIEGNKWIDAVTSWMDINGLDQLSARLGARLGGLSNATLFVLARYNAWFPGYSNNAQHACWADWNHLMRARLENPRSGVAELKERLLASIDEARTSIRNESYVMPIQNLALALNPKSVPPASG